ncbi:cytochrome P450 [Arthrobacter echini]|uniref:Cytochrome P450 n=1 Tax=Arthrobacter echini TaxID=1529066 RepID=A0A4S5EAQ3_9MICC|nr:cytochrome P450 [Arthrobacter echini]THJ68702.1 cytochrome P450 [Arthrobacter echini]
MKSTPFDSTIPFLREGYPFISSRCDAVGKDLFSSRLGLVVPVIFIRGADAAEKFYGEDRFTREGAMPPTIQHLLQDKGSVQTLEGDAHRVRKRAFMSLMSPAAMDGLGDVFESEWQKVEKRRLGRGSVKLHDMVREILTRAACQWAGVPLPEQDVPRITQELSLMIDQVARFGPRNWYAQLRRRGTESWVAGMVEQVRSGELSPREGSTLDVFSHHRDVDGELLSPEVAAVEIINILRPILAVSRFIVFAAVALHENPKWRDTFASGNVDDVEPFVQEVRRHYPFFPAVPGRVKDQFRWRDHDFRKGAMVILDIYGTCHDPRLFQDPDSFQPERFRGWSWDDNPYSLIAQGAGRHESSHRCPGEWSTVELMKRAVVLLSRAGYTVPSQDLTVPLSRFPSLPRSGFVISR